MSQPAYFNVIAAAEGRNPWSANPTKGPEMTTTPAPTDYDTLKADIKQAHDEICNIAEGKRRWTMSIPAKEATDSDLVISRALAGAERALDELAKTRAELEQAHAVLRAVDGWIERVGIAAEAVIILATDKTPGLALIADLALWNDRRRELLAEANPATTAEPADEPKADASTWPECGRGVLGDWCRRPVNHQGNCSPKVRRLTQPAATPDAAEPKTNVSVYYSDETGSHGWRCATCGNESRPNMPAHAAEDLMGLHRCAPQSAPAAGPAAG